MTTAQATKVRVAERKAIQSLGTDGRPPQRWFSVRFEKGGPVTVIAGGSFDPGVAFCVRHHSKNCECAQAVIDRGFLAQEEP
jgi:hypothetical protein